MQPLARNRTSFNSRSARARHTCNRCIEEHNRFNPRAHTGRDAAMPAERPTRYGFQSTRPHGARHTIKTIFGLIAMFQSTRPHGARPQYLQNSEVPPRVSIHAPTRGATEHILKLKVLIWSFNPRAHTGRDYNTAIITTVFAKFQSTRPHGARQCLRFGACTSVRFQSTRPHGARRSLADAQEFAPGFNPRAHTGRDIIAFVIILVYHVFQSTRPHGARPTILSNNRSLIGVSIHAPTRGATPASVRLRPHHIYSFNPRAHTGRDLFPAASRGGVFCVSIHAPTRGATTCIALLSRTLRVSIHAPTRGATASTPCAVRTQRSFNPRAHTGRDCSAYCCTPSSASFNPRAHTGRDGDFSDILLMSMRFNPRAHTGRDLLKIYYSCLIKCFNPRAHTGRDSSNFPSIMRGIGFNPRAHTGRD